MKYLKAFVAGIVIPALVLQIAVVLEAIFGWPPVQQIFFFHQLPLIWAVWNVAYFAYFQKVWPGGPIISYLIHGAILGLLLVIPAYILAIPRALGFTGSAEYFPVGFVPILYALLWAFALRPLNRVFNLT
jgi:hypothetical protein